MIKESYVYQVSRNLFCLKLIGNFKYLRGGACNICLELFALFPDKNTWSILHTQGALVQGVYGHSSVYDDRTKALYIHGGYKAFSANKYRLADDLYRYDVDTQMWWVLFLELSL